MSFLRLTTGTCCASPREFSVLQPGDEAAQDSFYELPSGFQRKSLKGIGMGGLGGGRPAYSDHALF